MVDDGRVLAGIFADPASLEVTHASIPLSSVVRAIHPATYVVGRYSTMAPQGDLTCSTVLITAPQVAIKTEHDALPLSNYQICSSPIGALAHSASPMKSTNHPPEMPAEPTVY